MTIKPISISLQRGISSFLCLIRDIVEGKLHRFKFACFSKHNSSIQTMGADTDMPDETVFSCFINDIISPTWCKYLFSIVAITDVMELIEINVICI